jgi:uncharacterized RDD family membrane protein YckC
MSERGLPTAPPIDPARLDDWLTAGVPARRVLGFLLDLLLIGVIVVALWAGLFLFGLLTLGLGFPLLGLLPAVPPLYHFLFLASPLSATPGQALLGLVVRRNADLGRPDVLEALVSVIGFYATLALGAVWLVVALLTTRHRALHDLLAGLVVVRADALAADALASVTPPLTPPGGGWNMRAGGPPHA